ncbi:MAG: type II toxin-antitoxin system death-on-curing family toxin [Ktedonobacteraceae bacterium]
MYNFLSEELIRALHRDQINLYGGVHGLRDANLLDSALNTPKAQFEGQSLYTSIFHVAAAYGFHISENQPFFKGNKRTAGMAMLVFLELNGFESVATSKDYYDVVMAVANKEMSKEQLANWLEKSVVRMV